MRNPEAHYRPDPSFARKYASEAQIATDIPVSTFVEVPALTTRPVDREQYKDEKHRRSVETLRAGIELASSEPGYRTALDAVSRLLKNRYTYSPGNMIRILGQMPDVTMVNSRDRWEKSGRHVKPEEKRRGLKVYVPQFRVVEDVNPQTGEIVEKKFLKGFSEGNVYDISQTEGPDIKLPEPSVDFTTTDGALELDKRVSLFGIGKGVIYEKRKLPEQMRGYFHVRDNRIAINDQLPPDDGRLKTIVHETIHAMEHGKQGSEGRDLAEVIAEGGSHAFLGYHNIDTSGYSFPYILRYSFDPDVMKLALPRIVAVTKELITGVEEEDPERMAEWN